jgi:hypothetical protein
VPAPFIAGMIPPCLITVTPVCRVAPISLPSTPIGAKRFSPMHTKVISLGPRLFPIFPPIFPEFQTTWEAGSTYAGPQLGQRCNVECKTALPKANLDARKEVPTQQVPPNRARAKVHFYGEGAKKGVGNAYGVEPSGQSVPGW